MKIVLLLGFFFAMTTCSFAEESSANTFSPLKMDITIDSQVMTVVNKDSDFSAQTEISISNDEKLIANSSNCAIHIRGTSTLESKKRGYAVNFPEVIAVLSETGAADYALVSNIYDPSFLRNKLAYDMACALSPEWSPAAEYCELYVNGEYQGLYLLVERITAQNMQIEKPQAFLCELTSAAKELFNTNDGNTWEIHYAGETVGESGTITDMNSICRHIITADSDIASYIDIDSWARKFLLDEIMINCDSNVNSTYVYKKNDGPLYCGPAWDYDVTCGVGIDNLYQFENFLSGLRDSWYYYLYQNSEFQERVKELYKTEYRPYIMGMINGGLQNLDSDIALVRERDYSKWENETEKCSTTRDASAPYSVQGICDCLSGHIAFLDSVWIDGEDHDLSQYDRIPPPWYEAFEKRQYIVFALIGIFLLLFLGILFKDAKIVRRYKHND